MEDRPATEQSRHGLQGIEEEGTGPRVAGPIVGERQ